MRVCLDVQSAVTQRAGVGRYTRALAGALGATAADHQLELFYFDFLRQGQPFPAPHATFKPNRWMPGRVAQAAWKRLNWPPFDLMAGQADLYHFPNFILPPLRKGKAIVTIHDVSFVRFPDFAEAANLRYLTAKIQDTIQRADAVITDSQFSADDIIEQLGAPPEKVFPIHLGIDTSFAPQPPEQVEALRRRYALNRPYLLAVGTIEPRKNIPFLVTLLEQLDAFDGDLVLAGMPGWKHEPIFARIASSPCAERIKHIAYVDDEDLPTLYSGAACLLQASFYEGFGFTPLEAMACGTPVVSSRGGSLPEVIGKAAPLLNTTSTDPWCEAVMEQINTRDTGRDSRMQHASRFTWQHTAEKTRDIYVKVTS